MRGLALLFLACVLVGGALAAWVGYALSGNGGVLFVALFLTLACLVAALRHGPVD